MGKEEEQKSNSMSSFIEQCLCTIEKQKIEIKEEMQNVEINICDLSKKIDSVEKSNDPVYSLFSPTEQGILDEVGKLNDEMNQFFDKLEELNKQYNYLLESYNNMKIIYTQINRVEKMSDCIIEMNYNKEGFLRVIDKVDDMGIKLLETQEIERKRIARDLHDSTVQELTNLVHKAELCSRLIDIDVIRAKMELEIMSGSIRDTINSMREIIYDLRPMSIDDLGLVSTIERYINQIMAYKDININFKVLNKEVSLLPVVSLTIFRIIQEACNNSIKYSKSNKIDIVLKYLSHIIELSVSDQGVGFDYETIVKNVDKNSKRGFGLSIMKERVYLLSGEIKIVSEEGKGTSILIKVPISTYMEEKDDTD